ncbi:DDE-type integrase/transposase/recombinase [Streptomyces sasae]|uniref:DDE-type integrase/transposase/recombinase n=1 Tax=Streptomyces sasae TaxID=1266772 RepID=UPI002930EBCF|nr:DDE-type integrase/transposase/recombinase [Streptomyces sasae]
MEKPTATTRAPNRLSPLGEDQVLTERGRCPLRESPVELCRLQYGVECLGKLRPCCGADAVIRHENGGRRRSGCGVGLDTPSRDLGRFRGVHESRLDVSQLGPANPDAPPERRRPGLQGARRGKKIRTTIRDDGHERACDPLRRDFTASRPNERRVADLTYAATWSGIVYVAFVVDVFSRAIVGWSAATSKRAELVLGALDMALWRRGRAGIPAGLGLAHHSDAGQLVVSPGCKVENGFKGFLAYRGAKGRCACLLHRLARQSVVFRFVPGPVVAKYGTGDGHAGPKRGVARRRASAGPSRAEAVGYPARPR